MQIERIEAQIEDAKIVERQTGVLHRAIINLARLNNVSVSGLEVEEVIEFVTQYIEHAPALMKTIEDAAAENGARATVQPIIDATEEYFLSTDDVIPDHYGLVGLLDDAYLTHSLMEAISDSYKSRSGESFLPMEAQDINIFIRRLIGEPFASILDEYVSTTFNGLSAKQDINQLCGALAQMNLSSAPDPIWGDADVSEIAGARLEAIGVF